MKKPITSRKGRNNLLTIARAILKDPQILILDEATSSVDTRLEKMLQEAMQRVMKGGQVLLLPIVYQLLRVLT